MKVHSPFSYKVSSNSFEFNSMEVVTVPAQSLTVAELLKRFRVGMPLMGTEPIYENDDMDDLDDPRRDPNFDLTDIPEYLEKVKEKKRFFESQKESRGVAAHHSPAPDGGSDGGLPEGTGGATKAPKVTDGVKPASDTDNRRMSERSERLQDSQNQ